MEPVLSVADRALARGGADQATANAALSGLHLSAEHCGLRDDSHAGALWAETAFPQAECQEWPQRLRAANLAGCRSEEHTSELQSRGHLVCRLLLEKKKTDKMK